MRAMSSAGNLNVHNSLHIQLSNIMGKGDRGERNVFHKGETDYMAKYQTNTMKAKMTTCLAIWRSLVRYFSGMGSGWMGDRGSRRISIAL